MFQLDPKKLNLAVLLDSPRPVTDSSGAEIVRDGQPQAYYVLCLVPATGSPVTITAKGPLPKGELPAGVVAVEGLEAVPYELRRGGKVEREGVAYRVARVSATSAP